MSTLSPDQWKALSPFFDKALSLSGDARAAWLASLKEQDAFLAKQLEALLNEHSAAEQESFLQTAPVTPFGEQRAGQVVGAYTLVSPIGHGGMGTVWLAERSDGRFEGKVAVKFLNFALAGRGGEDRFRSRTSLPDSRIRASPAD